jgi:hypothetical protein
MWVTEKGVARARFELAEVKTRESDRVAYAFGRYNNSALIEMAPEEMRIDPSWDSASDGNHSTSALPTIQAESSDPMSTMTSDISVATISGGTFSYAERCPYWGLALCLARLW